MNWNAIIRHYKSVHYPNHIEEHKWFKNQTLLSNAIQNAALSINQKGKRFDHQRRLKISCLENACQILLRLENRIKRCRTFDELINLIKDTLQNVAGVGELYYYDTALRIGAKLGLSPQRIYLHSGTRQGAKMLRISKGRSWIETKDVPKELQSLTPDEIEDILCIYKSRFWETVDLKI